MKEILTKDQFLPNNSEAKVDTSRELSFIENDSIEKNVDYSRELNFSEKESNPYLEKQSELTVLNQKLVSHLEQAGINDAIIYGPHNPKEYWDPNNTRIAFHCHPDLPQNTIILLFVCKGNRFFCRLPPISGEAVRRSLTDEGKLMT